MNTGTPTQGSRRSMDRNEDAAVAIGDGEKLINVVLLNGERLNVRVPSGATGQDLYNTITDHLGLTETIFFGLMIIKDGEHEFLDLSDKLSKLAKYAPHLWKDDVSCNSSLVFTIFFRVKYYVENICLLQQQGTRHLYYLQLRKDVLEGGIFVHEETAMLLASYALQAEVGDYNQSVHGNDYFVPEHYLPQRAIAKLTASYIRNTLPQLHKAHSGISDAQAEIEYLKEAQKLQEYGIIFNKVSKFKKDKRSSYSLGISVRGLIVFEERGIVKSPVFRHPWQNIKRMAFHRRRFFIEAHGPPETSKIVLYTNSYKKSRYLLKMCTSFYKFQMMMGMKLTSLREYPKDGSVKMNGVVKTDASDSPGRTSPVSDAGKSFTMEQGVIQQPGAGPAIHLNGSAANAQDNVQVSVYPVQLQKINGSLGLNIIGGIELGGIYVKTMAHDGSAALSGKVSIGDRILEINGNSLEGISRQDAVNLLRTAPQICTLLIESCVAAPATPNGKPAVPGNYSTTAFHQPNRSQPYAGEEYQYQDPYGSPQHQAYASSYEQMGPIDQYSEDTSVVSILAKNVLYFFGWEARTVSHAYSTPYGRGPGTVSMPGFQSRNHSRNQVSSRSSYNEYDSDYYYGNIYGEHTRYQNLPSESNYGYTWRSDSQNRFRTISMGSGRDSDVCSESGYQSQVQIPSSAQNSPLVPDINETIDNRSRKGNLLELKLYKYEEKRESVDSSFFSSATRENSFDDFPSYESETRITEEYNPLGRRDYPIKNEPQPYVDSNDNDLNQLYSKEEPGFVGRFFSYFGFESQGENDVQGQNYPESSYDDKSKMTAHDTLLEESSSVGKSGKPVEMKVFKRTESEEIENYHTGPCSGQNYEDDDQLRYQYSKTLQASGMLYQDDMDYGYYGDQPQETKQEVYRDDKNKAINKTFDDDFSIYDDENVGLFGETIERPSTKTSKLSKTKAFPWFSSKDSETDNERKSSTEESKPSSYRFGGLFSSDKRKNSDISTSTAEIPYENKFARDGEAKTSADNKKYKSRSETSPEKKDTKISQASVAKETYKQDQIPFVKKGYFSWFSDRETETPKEQVAKNQGSNTGFFGGFFPTQATQQDKVESTTNKEMTKISKVGKTSDKSDAQTSANTETVLSNTGIPGLTLSFVEEFERPKTPPTEKPNETNESQSGEAKTTLMDDLKAVNNAVVVDNNKLTEDNLEANKTESKKEFSETVDKRPPSSKASSEPTDGTKMKVQSKIEPIVLEKYVSVGKIPENKEARTEDKGGYFSWFTTTSKENGSYKPPAEEERRGSMFGSLFSSSSQSAKQDVEDKSRKEIDTLYNVSDEERRGSLFGSFFSSSSQQPKRNVEKPNERKTSGESAVQKEHQEIAMVDMSKDNSEIKQGKVDKVIVNSTAYTETKKETAKDKKENNEQKKEGDEGVFTKMIIGFKGVFGKTEPVNDTKDKESEKEDPLQKEARLKEARRKERISQFVKEFSMKEDDVQQKDTMKEHELLQKERKNEDAIQNEARAKEAQRKERISKFVKEFSVKEEDIKLTDIIKKEEDVSQERKIQYAIDSEAHVKEAQRKEMILKFVKKSSMNEEEEDGKQTDLDENECFGEAIVDKKIEEETKAQEITKDEASIRDARRKKRISQFIDEFSKNEEHMKENTIEENRKRAAKETEFIDDMQEHSEQLQKENNKQDDNQNVSNMKEERKKERILRLIKEFSLKEEQGKPVASESVKPFSSLREDAKEDRRKELISQLVKEFSLQSDHCDSAEISEVSVSLKSSMIDDSSPHQERLGSSPFSSLDERTKEFEIDNCKDRRVHRSAIKDTTFQYPVINNVSEVGNQTGDVKMGKSIVDITNEDYASICVKELPKEVPIPVFRYGWQREKAIFRPKVLNTKEQSDSPFPSRALAVREQATVREGNISAKGLDMIDIDKPSDFATFEHFSLQKEKPDISKKEYVNFPGNFQIESPASFVRSDMSKRERPRKAHANKQGRPKSPNPFLLCDDWQDEEDDNTVEKADQSYKQFTQEETDTDWSSYDTTQYETEVTPSIFDEAYDVPSEIDIEDQLGQHFEECFYAVQQDEEMLNTEYGEFQSEYQNGILDDQTFNEKESNQKGNWDMKSSETSETNILIPKFHLITDAVREERLQHLNEEAEKLIKIKRTANEFENDIEQIEGVFEVGFVDESVNKPFIEQAYEETIPGRLKEEELNYNECEFKVEDVSNDYVRSLKKNRRKINETWDGIMKELAQECEENQESSSNETVDQLPKAIIDEVLIENTDKEEPRSHGETYDTNVIHVLKETDLNVTPHSVDVGDFHLEKQEEKPKCSDQEEDILKRKAERALKAAKQNEEFSEMIKKFKEKFMDESRKEESEKQCTPTEIKNIKSPSEPEKYTEIKNVKQETSNHLSRDNTVTEEPYDQKEAKLNNLDSSIKEAERPSEDKTQPYFSKEQPQEENEFMGITAIPDQRVDIAKDFEMQPVDERDESKLDTLSKLVLKFRSFSSQTPDSSIQERKLSETKTSTDVLHETPPTKANASQTEPEKLTSVLKNAAKETGADYVSVKDQKYTSVTVQKNNLSQTSKDKKEHPDKDNSGEQENKESKEAEGLFAKLAFRMTGSTQHSSNKDIKPKETDKNDATVTKDGKTNVSGVSKPVARLQNETEKETKSTISVIKVANETEKIVKSDIGYASFKGSPTTVKPSEEGSFSKLLSSLTGSPSQSRNEITKHGSGKDTPTKSVQIINTDNKKGEKEKDTIEAFTPSHISKGAFGVPIEKVKVVQTQEREIKPEKKDDNKDEGYFSKLISKMAESMEQQEKKEKEAERLLEEQNREVALDKFKELKAVEQNQIEQQERRDKLQIPEQQKAKVKPSEGLFSRFAFRVSDAIQHHEVTEDKDIPKEGENKPIDIKKTTDDNLSKIKSETVQSSPQTQATPKQVEKVQSQTVVEKEKEKEKTKDNNQTAKTIPVSAPKQKEVKEGLFSKLAFGLLDSATKHEEISKNSENLKQEKRPMTDGKPQSITQEEKIGITFETRVETNKPPERKLLQKSANLENESEKEPKQAKFDSSPPEDSKNREEVKEGLFAKLAFRLTQSTHHEKPVTKSTKDNVSHTKDLSQAKNLKTDTKHPEKASEPTTISSKDSRVSEELKEGLFSKRALGLLQSAKHEEISKTSENLKQAKRPLADVRIQLSTQEVKREITSETNVETVKPPEGKLSKKSANLEEEIEKEPKQFKFDSSSPEDRKNEGQFKESLFAKFAFRLTESTQHEKPVTKSSKENVSQTKDLSQTKNLKTDAKPDEKNSDLTAISKSSRMSEDRKEVTKQIANEKPNKKEDKVTESLFSKLAQKLTESAQQENDNLKTSRQQPVLPIKLDSHSVSLPEPSNTTLKTEETLMENEPNKNVKKDENEKITQEVKSDKQKEVKEGLFAKIAFGLVDSSQQDHKKSGMIQGKSSSIVQENKVSDIDTKQVKVPPHAKTVEAQYLSKQKDTKAIGQLDSKGKEHVEKRDTLFSKLAFKITEYVHENDTAKIKTKAKEHTIQPTIKQDSVPSLDKDPSGKKDGKSEITKVIDFDKSKSIKFDTKNETEALHEEQTYKAKENEIKKQIANTQKKEIKATAPSPKFHTPQQDINTQKADEMKSKPTSQNSMINTKDVKSTTESQASKPSEGFFSRFVLTVDEIIHQKEPVPKVKEKINIPVPESKHKIPKTPVNEDDGLFSKLGIFDDDYIKEDAGKVMKHTPPEERNKIPQPESEGNVNEDRNKEPEVSYDMLKPQEKDGEKIVSDDIQKVKIKDALELNSEEKFEDEVKKPKTLLELVQGTTTVEKETNIILKEKNKLEVVPEQIGNKDFSSKDKSNQENTKEEIKSESENLLQSVQQESNVDEKKDAIKEAIHDSKPFMEELFSKLIFLESSQKLSEECKKPVSQNEVTYSKTHSLTEILLVGEENGNVFCEAVEEKQHSVISRALSLPDLEVMGLKDVTIETADDKIVLPYETFFSEVKEVQGSSLDSAVVFEEDDKLVRKIDIHTTKQMRIKSDSETRLQSRESDVFPCITTMLEKDLPGSYISQGLEYTLAKKDIQEKKGVPFEQIHEPIESSGLKLSKNADKTKIGKRASKMSFKDDKESTLSEDITSTKQSNAKEGKNSESTSLAKTHFSFPNKEDGGLLMQNVSVNPVQKPQPLTSVKTPKNTEKQSERTGLPIKFNDNTTKAKRLRKQGIEYDIKGDVRKYNLPSKELEMLPTQKPKQTVQTVKDTICHEKEKKVDIKEMPRSKTGKHRVDPKAPEKPSPNKEESRQAEEGYFSRFVTKVLASPEVERFKKTYLQQEEEINLEEMAEFYAKKNQEARIIHERETLLKSKDSSKKDPGPAGAQISSALSERDSAKVKAHKTSFISEESIASKEQLPLKTSIQSKGTERPKKRVSFEENIETKMFFSKYNDSRQHAESVSRSKPVGTWLMQPSPQNIKDTDQPEEGYFSRIVSKILAPSEEEIHLKPQKTEEVNLEETALFYAKKNEEARQKKQQETLDKEINTKLYPELSVNEKSFERKIAQEPGAKEQIAQKGKEKDRNLDENKVRGRQKAAEGETKSIGGKKEKLIEQGIIPRNTAPSFPLKKEHSQPANRNYLSSFVSEWFAPQSKESQQREVSPLVTYDDINLEEMAAFYAKQNAEARSSIAKEQEQSPTQSHATNDEDSKIIPATNPRISEQSSKGKDDKNAQEVPKPAAPVKLEMKNTEKPQPREEGYLSKIVSRMLQTTEPEDSNLKPVKQLTKINEETNLEEMAAYYAKKNEEARKALHKQPEASGTAQEKIDKIEKKTVNEKEQVKPAPTTKNVTTGLSDARGTMTTDDSSKKLQQTTQNKSFEVASKKPIAPGSYQKKTSKRAEEGKEKLGEKQYPKNLLEGSVEQLPERKETETHTDTDYLSRFILKKKGPSESPYKSQPQMPPVGDNDEKKLEQMTGYFAKQNQEARKALQKENVKEKRQEKIPDRKDNQSAKDRKTTLPKPSAKEQVDLRSKAFKTEGSVEKNNAHRADLYQRVKSKEESTEKEKAVEGSANSKNTEKDQREQRQKIAASDKTDPLKKTNTEKTVDKPPETVSEAVSGLMKWGRSMFK